MRTAAKTSGKTRSKASAGSASKAKKDIAASYNAYKFFNGKQYTGMAVSKTAKKAAERLKKVKPPVKKQRIAELA